MAGLALPILLFAGEAVLLVVHVPLSSVVK
jgi:hypothetical protein